jgi:DNA-binding FadR family transcriptional regulator
MRRPLDRIIKSGEPDGLTHLVEVREILEPEIAALAATRADYEDLAAMREAVDVMDHAGRDSDAYVEADLDFHLALAEAAANPIVLSLIDSIVALLREQRVRIYHVEGGADRGQHYHRRILEAIERHDPQGARTAMQAHLWQVREDSRNTAGNPPAAE